MYIFAILSYGLYDPARRYVTKKKCLPSIIGAYNKFLQEGNESVLVYFNNDDKQYITESDYPNLGFGGSAGNIGVYGYNHCFEQAADDDILVELDCTTFIRHDNDIIRFFNFFDYVEENHDNVGFVGMDYYVPKRDRDHPNWKGAATYGTSHGFKDDNAMYMESSYGNYSVFTRGCEKGLVPGGFRACRASTWRAIGGQPEFLYGTDRWMNIMALREGYSNFLVHNINIEKITTNNGEYQKWKHEYLTKNCILPENEDGETWHGGRR